MSEGSIEHFVLKKDQIPRYLFYFFNPINHLSRISLNSCAFHHRCVAAFVDPEKIALG
jgi:hypothetical protein